MHELRMGYKQSLLQRLQQFEMSAYQKSETQAMKNETDGNTPAAGAVGVNVTDFSIQRILGDSPEKPKPSQSPQTSSSSLTQDTPPSSPKLYAPVATKAPLSGVTDILDLSKTKATGTNLSANNPNSGMDFPYGTPNFSYPAIHPNILAAVAAQKFYAQFLPHMFSGVPATPAVMAGLYNQIPQLQRSPVSVPSSSSYQKRYFAPYVLNNNNTQKSNPAQSPLTPPTPTSLTTQSTTHCQPATATTTPTKYLCSRLDCAECLDTYYKTPHTNAVGYAYKSPILSPTASTISSSSSYHSKVQKDVLLSSSNISLTSVTNIHLNASKATVAASTHMASLFESRGTISNNSEEISYKCRICDKVFGCSQTLQAHEKTHKSPRYECTDCGKGFSQLRNYKYHLSVHRGTKEFAAECPECGKTFNDKGYLSSHMKIHRNKKEYECPYCPKSFNQRVAFNMHVRIHTGVKPHKCAECGKRFSRKMLLKQHMRTHSGEKPYQCSVCGKSFADRSNMTLHHRLHSGIKPFNCPICPKAFTKKHHLKTHLNYHTGCKPYVCPHPNCNQAFTQSSNMRTHAKKCQYRPLQMTQFPTGAVASSGSSTMASGGSMASAIDVKSSISVASSSSMAGQQSLLLNTISRLPSTAGGSSSHSLYRGVNGPISNSSSSLSTTSHNTGSNIPYMPSTTLSAGIRMLSTVHNSSSVALSAGAAATTAAAAVSTGFPPAQQPLLSTLRPF